MTKLMNLACLGLALMTAATAAAQFTNGNGDAATFSTVNSEIDSWWGLGIRSSCCNSYSGYGVVFDTRSGSIYTQGSIGVGTASPQAMLTVGSLAPGASEATNKGLIQIEGNADINSGTNGIEFKASSSGSGFGWKVFSPDRLNSNAPLVFAYRASNASWTELVTMRTDTGNVGIGTTNPQYSLSVNGTIQAKEVLVNTGWADYVFQPGYRVRPLAEVAAFIKANHHLPDIPSETEIKDKGVSLGDMQTKLLAKIEELTLQMIQLDEKNRALAKRVVQIQAARVARSGRNGGR